MTFPTGLLKSSVTLTERGTGSVAPTVSFCRSPPFLVIRDAPPIVAVIVKVTVAGPLWSVAVAVVVCVPGVTPRVRVVVACPLTSVVEKLGFTDPPPVAARQSTRTPETGFPPASLTSTSCGVASVVPTCPVSGSPELLTSDAGGPTVAVAVNVTELPARPAALALSVFAPAVGPSVQEATAAMPSAPVATGVAGFTVPSPDVTAKVTETPFTGLPLASVTSTDGGLATAVPAVADWVTTLCAAIWVAGPAATFTAADVAPLSPGVPNPRVRGPTVPAIERFVKVAAPAVFVVAVAVPPRAPPPEAIAAVTVTPDWLTALPAPSRTCTTGCWANATPLCAVPDGCVVNVSSVAVPAPSVIGPEVTGGSPVAAKLSV